MMLALRRVSGAPWPELDAWAGRDLRKYYRTEVDRLRGEGLIEEPGRSVRLTRRGVLMADTAAEAFF